MRRITRLSALLVLAFTFTTAHAHTADPAAVFPELEPITIENAARLMQLPGELTDVNKGFDVSPDGRQIAVARPDGVYLYDMGSFETPVAIFEIPDADDVYGPQFSPDGKLLSISTIDLGSEGQLTQLWTLHTKTILQEFRTNWPLNGGATFSPDGHFLAGYDTSYYTCQGGCDIASSLFVWTADRQAEAFCSYYNCHGRYGIGGFAFTPDSKALLWSMFDFSGGDIQNGEYFWNAVDLVPTDDEENTGESTAVIPPGLESHFQDRTGPFAGDINSIWFSPDGLRLVARNREQSLDTVWDVETGTEILALPQGVRIAAFLPDQTILVVDDTQHTESILQVETGEQVILFDNLNDNEFISPANSEVKLLVSWENFETVHFYGVPAKSE